MADRRLLVRIVETPEGDTYLIDESGYKHWIKDKNLLGAVGLSPGMIQGIPQAEIDRMPGAGIGDPHWKGVIETVEDIRGHYKSPGQQTAEIAADIIDEYIAEQEEVLADIGVFDWDEEQARQDALDIIGPFFERELGELEGEIKEKRLVSAEDFAYRMENITDQATNELKKLDIREAETTEQLAARLEDIQAKTEYTLGAKGREWRDVLRKEESRMLRAGLGFSGVMQERTRELEEAREAEMGEIGRRGTVAEEAEERAARYSLEEVRAARENVAAYEGRETGRAETLAKRGIRAYGYEGTPPPEITPAEPYGEYGRVGGIERARLERERETAALAQINRLYEQQLQEHQMARELALGKLPTYQQYFTGEYAKRSPI